MMTNSDALLNPDMPSEQIKLHMGEMSAQDVRNVRAAIRWANEKAAARICELEATMSKWQPIETAPKDGTTILLAHRFWRQCGIGMYQKGLGWLHIASMSKVPHPHLLTHWMPLPEPPTKEKAND
jgi:hypothetical protein